ncbi:hypothetical protein DES52_112152, partial [Deinococcus yavapaiensis KR-236]
AEGEEPEGHRGNVNFYQYAQYGTPDPTLPIVHVDVTDTVEVAAQVYWYYARHLYGATGDLPMERFKIERGEASFQTGAKFTERFTVKRMYHPPVPYLT